MKKAFSWGFLMVMILTLSACLAPQGSSLEQKRSVIIDMHDETMAQLYQQSPTSRDVIDKSFGYAVFSNVNAQYLIIGGGGGYGFSSDRVLKLNRISMESQTIEAFAVPVQMVSKYRMAKCRHMDADLVGSTGFGKYHQP